MIAPVLRKNVEIRTLAYGRETSVAGVCGYYVQWTTGLREAERAGSLVRTESDDVVEVHSVRTILFVWNITASPREAWGVGCIVEACFQL